MNQRKTADQSLMREMNTSIILHAIRLSAPLSRAELATRTGLTRSTVSLIIDDLIDREFVQETTISQVSKVGRPGMLLQFNPEGGCVIGVEIGVDFISVILTNFIGQVLWRHKRMTSEQETQLDLLQIAENIIDEALHYGKKLDLRPLGIGVGVPGLVDSHQGKLVFAPNLHWVDVPLRQIWTKRFDLPVFVENEANCACLGEYFYGIAHTVKDFLFLKTGVGLGGGVMIDGKLFRGSSGFAGEIGHITIYESDVVCACGRKGCLETFVRPSSLLAHVAARLKNGEASLLHEIVGPDLSRLSIEHIAEAARQNDALAISAIEALGVHFGIGITNLVNIFNPELVVFGGTLVPLHPWMIPVIAATLQKNVLPPLRKITRIEPSSHGEDACLLGAVALVMDDILREPLNIS